MRNQNDGLPIARLASCYEWACDKCGLANMTRPLPFEGTEEEMAEICDEHGFDPESDGELEQVPRRVRCAHCQTVHFVELPGQDDDE